MTKTNITELSTSQIQELLKLKAAVDEKKAKQQAYNEKRRIWMHLMIEKAEKAGIEVTTDEIAVEMKKLADAKKK